MMLRFKSPAELYLWNVDHGFIRLLCINNLNKLGVSKLLGLHHNTADFQLTKHINFHED